MRPATRTSSTTTSRSRRLILTRACAVGLVTVAALTLAGCKGDDKPTWSTPEVAGVLSRSDLPSPPASATDEDTSEGATVRCGTAGGGASLTTFTYKHQVIAYKDVDGLDVTSASYFMGADKVAQTIKGIKTSLIKHCTKPADDGEREKLLTGLPKSTLGFVVTDSPLHKKVVQLYADAGQAIVQITVFADDASDTDPVELGTKLIAKARTDAIKSQS